ncbi:MAG: hypothetical protein KDA28_05600, partial [Phycisphaerales bacterium]|nr:hypothetical protein [Phycisphaerales bacterium]
NALLWVIMLHLTMYGWLLFRAQNIGTIWIFTRDILTSPGSSWETWRLGGDILHSTWFLILFQIIQHFQGLEPLGKWHWFIRLNIWILVLTSLLRMSATGGSEFIYFAF